MIVRYRDKQWTLEGRQTVREVIQEIGVMPNTVLAMRDGKMLSEDVLLEDSDDIRLVPVISGG